MESDEETFLGFSQENLATQRLSSSALQQALDESSVDLGEESDEVVDERAPGVPIEPIVTMTGDPIVPEAETKLRGELDLQIVHFWSLLSTTIFRHRYLSIHFLL